MHISRPLPTELDTAAARRVAPAKPGLLRRLVRRAIRGILPKHTYTPLRFELHMAWVRWKSRSMAQGFRGRDNLLVNFGAGEAGTSGWVNVDAYARPGVNCVYDARTQLPFPDGSTRGIFCEHFLEHIDYYDEAPRFLAECRRALKPGGVLRLIVPDAELYLRAYCDGVWERLSEIRPLDSERADFYTGVSYNTPLELVNWIFRQGSEHRFAYDYQTLAHLLHRSGFEQVERRAFGQSALPEICLDQKVRASESLYVEAIK